MSSLGNQYTLAQIIKMLKKIRDRLKQENSFSVDKEDQLIIQNIDFLINNYESMSGFPTSEGHIPAQYQKMLSEMVKSMSEQMGVDFEAEMLADENNTHQLSSSEEVVQDDDIIALAGQILEESSITSETESNHLSAQEHTHEVTITEIDKKLQNPKLTIEEVDALLSERIRLMKR